VPSAPIVGECQNFDSICKLYSLYRTTILEFNRFLTDFGYELSNNKCEQLLPSSVGLVLAVFPSKSISVTCEQQRIAHFFQCMTSRDVMNNKVKKIIIDSIDCCVDQYY
jgi:hypothetical protein